MDDPKILIVEFGSQYTKLIAQRLRELGYRSAVLPPKKSVQWMKHKHPQAIILSGSRHGVNSLDAPRIDESVIQSGVPILGICYGMQLLTKTLGGRVTSISSESEYGPSQASLQSSELFRGLPKDLEVLASHGDTVRELPPGFMPIATDAQGAVAAMENIERKIWGVQFHPETQQTPLGKHIIENFVSSISSCGKDWDPGNMIGQIQNELTGTIGDGIALMGFSGGVDSTTLFGLASLVLGDRIKPVCIDGGQLREGELDEIRFNAEIGSSLLRIIDARREFQDAWNPYPEQKADPELKRKLFKKTYQSCLARSANGASFLLQGTLGPDMIESGATGGDCIKSHHNIGITLPGCTSLHPFSHLFKYEVREMAKCLGFPDRISQRQPFPGPGLFIRVINGWPVPERLDILRAADRKVRDIVHGNGLDKEISQLVVALDCGFSVGVKGDERSFGHPIIVRAVSTLDFMTAEAYQFPPEIRKQVTRDLTRFRKITRVFWDETPKPPGTIEFE